MRKLFAAMAAVPMFFAPAVTMAQQGSGPTMASQSAFDFTFDAIEGGPLPLAQFRGRVLLVVNVASFCGFTKQYEGLQTLDEKYAGRGLVVLGVPSNDFGEQEPGTSAEIKTFCQGAFGVTFPLTEKVSVKGASAHPFYAWALERLGPSAAPTWNFHKYLMGRDGMPIAAFNTRLEPTAREIVQAIEAALATEPKS